jgi:hypothetical protein
VASSARRSVGKAIADAARELVRHRDALANASEDDLKVLTLTKLYNQRPAWLENAHQSLDRAVFAAYGLTYPLSKDEIIRHLLELNRERAAGHIRVQSSGLPPKKSPRGRAPSKENTCTFSRGLIKHRKDVLPTNTPLRRAL